MKLLRVQVPNFRALKDVDISFEPDFTPQVFPLGSLNGGGKSTLLQLIFVLLHCSAHKERHQFIRNMLDSVIIPEGETNQTLAKIDLLDDEGEKIELDFTICNDGYLALLCPDVKVDRNFSNNIPKALEPMKQLLITKNSNQSIILISYFIVIRETIDQYKELLALISTKIFLSSPVNQIYLFLNTGQQKSLFIKNNNAYENNLLSAKKSLLNFKTYDILSPEIIANLFENARNKDFKIMDDTGDYGKNYKKLSDELSLFANKKITPKLGEGSKVIGVIFTSKEGINLKPEDLSHGELKRLSLYVWLKTMPQGGNIVLMDEVENGFHPQWQRYIADDLVEWQESNQYILATHSYELCRGVTPAHVKELSPDLFDKD